VKNPRGGGEKRRERMIRSDEMPSFYRAVHALRNTRDRDLIMLLLFTGLRFTEAAGMRWEDVDFPQRAIRLPAARTKARRRLDLPMTTQVRDLLVARRAVGIEGDFVFPAMMRTAETGHAVALVRSFNAIAKTCGFRVSPHDLRRGYATISEGCDISWSALIALLNHAAPAGVTGGYVRVTLDRLREPAQRVADKIAELSDVTQPEGVTKLA
jgi:integrase